MYKIYLSLGSNIGDTKGNLDKALGLLKEKISILKQSSYYETEPVGYQYQDWFLNIVIEGETSLPPKELLSFTQSIEIEMKRVKTIRFGPRIIDVDILLYDDLEIDSADLIVPHPRMCERAFVLIPLYEIAPSLVIDGIAIKELVSQLCGQEIHKKDYDNEES